MGNEISREWAVVIGAPIISLVALVVLGGIAWLVLHFLYRHRIDGLKEELDRERAETARLRSRGAQEPKPSPPPALAPPERKAARSKPAAIKTPQDGPRIFVGEDITPTYLRSFFHNHTVVEGRRMIEAYMNKWMRISGPVEDASDQGSTGHVVNIAARDAKSKFYMEQVACTALWFQRETETLEMLRKGDVITAIGRIDSVDKMGLVLHDCELVSD